MNFSLQSQRRLRQWVYGSGFFLNVSLAVSAYINSSFIASFVGERWVGLLYAGAYLLSLIAALNVHRIISVWGLRQTLTNLLAASLVALAGIIFFQTLPLGIAFLGLWLVISFLVTISLDLYLEHFSHDRVTGAIRGLFLTLINLAWLLSPLLASRLNETYGFAAVYLVVALATFPLLLIALTQLRELSRRNYRRTAIWQTLRQLWRSRRGSGDSQIQRVLILDFLLNFFYATMVIYMPLYLHNHIGFAWGEIGIILTIMLLPFVLLDLWLGRLADELWGEKELMIAGIIIAGLATLLIPFITVANLWLWAALLFTTRVGAASLEIMKESYLFKRISSQDLNILLLSRSLYPLSYIVAPLLASLILWFAPYPLIFTILGLIVLLGLPAAWRLKDTR
jgi:MFS family permease